MGAKTEESESEKNKTGQKSKEYREIRVNLYLTATELIAYAEEARKVRVRPVQAKPFVKKPHGFADETEPNTTGISKFIRKHLFPFWIEQQAERDKRIAEIREKAEKEGLELIDKEELKELRRLEKEARKIGMEVE